MTSEVTNPLPTTTSIKHFRKEEEEEETHRGSKKEVIHSSQAAKQEPKAKKENPEKQARVRFHVPLHMN